MSRLFLIQRLPHPCVSCHTSILHYFNMTVSVPTNVRQLNDARIASLLDKLRDRALKPFEVRSVVHDLATVICKNVEVTAGEDETLAVIVVLRSGLAMFDGFMENVPETVSTAVYHMGIFRDQASLQPVEYYNKLPLKPSYIKQAYVLDPLIATGGTAGAVVSILKYVKVYPIRHNGY